MRISRCISFPSATLSFFLSFIFLLFELFHWVFQCSLFCSLDDSSDAQDFLCKWDFHFKCERDREIERERDFSTNKKSFFTVDFSFFYCCCCAATTAVAVVSYDGIVCVCFVSFVILMYAKSCFTFLLLLPLSLTHTFCALIAVDVCTYTFLSSWSQSTVVSYCVSNNFSPGRQNTECRTKKSNENW